MNSSPTSLASTGLCKWTFGNPGIAPMSTSSMLGCSAAVIEIVSPSQPRPAVSQTIWTSLTSGGRPLNVDSVVAIVDPPSYQLSTTALLSPYTATFNWKTDDDGPAETADSCRGKVWLRSPENPQCTLIGIYGLRVELESGTKRMELFCRLSERQRMVERKLSLNKSARRLTCVST